MTTSSVTSLSVRVALLEQQFHDSKSPLTARDLELLDRLTFADEQAEKASESADAFLMQFFLEQ